MNGKNYYRDMMSSLVPEWQKKALIGAPDPSYYGLNYKEVRECLTENPFQLPKLLESFTEEEIDALWAKASSGATREETRILLQQFDEFFPLKVATLAA